MNQASIQEAENPLTFDKETVSSADSFPPLAAMKNKIDPIFSILKRGNAVCLSTSHKGKKLSLQASVGYKVKASLQIVERRRKIRSAGLPAGDPEG